MTIASSAFLRVPRTLVLTAALLTAAPALAHHGWSWTEEAQMTLPGTIAAISMAPPHPMLRVTAADGVVWQVDLGNPNQTANSGFTGTTAKPGDAVIVTGNRSLDKSRAHMKAVRITIAGRNYDMYPERIRTN
ncbi:MAG TPA: DUF6152 family protein [Xanthobacteraceae bacterium]|nr:DUF6152 family protein [Xanthobacteraceae bacterium]